MTLSSTILVPEIQYYFSKFVKGSTLNKNLTWFPEEMDILYLYDNKSFIRLLFDEDYPHTSYKYLYRETVKSEWPIPVQIRLGLFPASGQYYLCDSTSCDVNLFLLESDDFMMLDLLLSYRRDPLSVSIDSTSYEVLTTNLSKLIFIYLDLKVNENYSWYDNSTLISDESNVLECIYENYIIEEIFKFIQDRQVIDPQT